MPRKTQKSVTLNKKVYDKAKEEAEKQDKSVAGFLTDLIKSQCEEVAPQVE